MAQQRTVIYTVFCRLFLFLLPLLSYSQPDWAGPKALGVVPLTGKGTWEDPRRPDLPKELSGNYRWLPSDDGKWAIVQIGEGTGSAEVVEALRKMSEQAETKGVRLFRPGVDAKTEVEAVVRRFRITFSMEELSAAAVAARGPK